MHEKQSPGINVGNSSLLFIFLTLALISFASLSLSSAQADSGLTGKIAQRTQGYYDACNEAQKQLAEADARLAALCEAGLSEEYYFARAGGHIDFSVPVSDSQALNVSLKVLWPEEEEKGPYYRVVVWQVVPTGELTYEDSHKGLTQTAD